VKKAKPKSSGSQSPEPVSLDVLRAIFENSPVPIVVSNPEGELLYCNRALEKMTGYTAKDFPDVAAWAGLMFADEGYRTFALDNIHRSMRGEPLDTSEYRIRRKDGAERRVIVVISYLDHFYVVQFQDITELRESQEALERGEQQYRSLIEHLNIGVYRNTGGPHGIFLQANPAIATMFGYDSVEEFMEVHVSDLYQDPSDRKLFVQEALAKGFAKDKELRLKKKDGTPIWCSCTAKVVYHETGGIKWLDGVIEDITERKAAEELLTRNEARLRNLEAVITRSPAVVFRWRIAEGWPVEFVTENVSQFGYTAEDFTAGRVSWPGITHPDDHPRLEAEVAGFLEKGADQFSQTYRLFAKDGSVRWIEDSNQVIRDSNGEITHIQGIILDVTQQKETVARLAEGEHEYRTLCSHIPGMVYQGKTDWTTRMIHGVDGLCGYPAEDFDSGRRNWLDLVHADDKDRVLEEADSLSLRPTRLVQTYRIVAKDGTVHWVEDYKLSLFDENGFYAGVYGIVFDITARKETEEELHRKSGLLARAQAIASIGSWSLNFSTRKLEFSAEACATYGFDPKTFDGNLESVLSRIHPDDRDKVKDATEVAVADHALRPIEFRVKRPDGTVRFVNSRSDLLRDAAGEITGLIGTLQDITERRQLEQRILDISNRERQRIGQTLHDSLGQELTGMAFLSKALENELKRKSLPMAGEAERLTHLIKSAVGQTKRIAYGLAPVDLEAEGLALALRRLAEDTTEVYGVICHCVAPRPAPIHDNRVATHLFYVAQEAVSNAIRHGEAGRIEITLNVSDHHGKLTVADNGSGMPEKPANARGMGLEIMRYRAEMIGGSVTIGLNGKGGTAVTCDFENRKG